jgi:hypothetical protein
MKWLLFSCLRKKDNHDDDDEDIDGTVHGYSNYKIPHNEDTNINEVKHFNYLECSICLNIIYDDEYDFIKENQNHKTECDHIFHNECIKQWYKVSNSVSCPLCHEDNINDMIIIENFSKYMCSGYCYRNTQKEQMIEIDDIESDKI